jgi:hypothetical protein
VNDPTDVTGASASFRGVEWRDEYRTSAIRPGEPATDILREFYIPVLERSVRYDRVAGYFRSSSLAAASQGFTAFARNGAKARLLVGCDLDEKDVKAALAGADEALVAQLTAALENDGSWTGETVRGVDLFAHPGGVVVNLRRPLINVVDRERTRNAGPGARHSHDPVALIFFQTGQPGPAQAALVEPLSP